MNTPAIQSITSVGQDPADAASFDNAIDQAQQQLSEGELVEKLLEGAMSIAGPMLIMPKANEILGEAMSDE
jgi:predicted N-acetyltransferase YhbS